MVLARCARRLREGWWLRRVRWCRLRCHGARASCVSSRRWDGSCCAAPAETAETARGGRDAGRALLPRHSASAPTRRPSRWGGVPLVNEGHTARQAPASFHGTAPRQNALCDAAVPPSVDRYPEGRDPLGARRSASVVERRSRQRRETLTIGSLPRNRTVEAARLRCGARSPRTPRIRTHPALASRLHRRPGCSCTARIAVVRRHGGACCPW